MNQSGGVVSNPSEEFLSVGLLILLQAAASF